MESVKIILYITDSRRHYKCQGIF